MEIAVLLLWAASLISFLASKTQNLLAKPLPKIVAWPVFVIFTATGSYLFTAYYSLAVSLISGLACISFMWISLVLFLGHFHLKLLPISILGSFSIVLLIQLGGN